MNDWPILSLLLWFPLVSGLVTMWLPVLFAKRFAVASAAITLGLALLLWSQFDTHVGFLQWTENYAWAPQLNIRYDLGVDGIALAMILLTALSVLGVVCLACVQIKRDVRFYLACVLILEGLVHGVFVAVDVFLFYIFWEAVLIPMYLLIGLWGGERRVYASVKFFIYTFLGSVLMLLALLYLSHAAESSKLTHFYPLKLSLWEQQLLFLAFFAAFAVKIPMWPVHTWLPDAHVEAPTGGSVLLAAILLKMGAFGFLRFSLPILPDACAYFSPYMVGLSLVAVFYIGLVALVQTDMKKVIAYSSIAHMGFVTLGLFLGFMAAESDKQGVSQLAIHGAVIQMISHGFISAGLFFGVGVLYDRLHSRRIQDYGGVVHTMPVFAALFLVLAMANAGLPGTSGFVAELWVILAAWVTYPPLAVVAASTLLWGAAYTLWMYKRVVWGPIYNPNVAQMSDVTLQEKTVLWACVFCVVLFGVYPQPVVQLIAGSVEQLTQDTLRSKFA